MNEIAKRQLKKFAFYLFTPIAVAFGLVFTEFYKAFFGWWLDAAVDDRNHQALAEDIRENLGFLFDAHGARIIPNTRSYPRSANYAVVTIGVAQMLLRFVRGRDEFRVDVSPAHAPKDWQEVGQVIGSDPDYRGSPNPPTYYRFQDFSKLLKANFDILDRLMSPENYGPPRRDLSVIKSTRL
jgi:hypothetical protein